MDLRDHQRLTNHIFDFKVSVTATEIGWVEMHPVADVPFPAGIKRDDIMGEASIYEDVANLLVADSI
ncbi:hypothetical protein CVS48_25285 [Achromobacter spanius]|nr:hypothetical protein CVS48_25285 [Achromobacter spanius]